MHTDTPVHTWSLCARAPVRPPDAHACMAFTFQGAGQGCTSEAVLGKTTGSKTRDWEGREPAAGGRAQGAVYTENPPTRREGCCCLLGGGSVSASGPVFQENGFLVPIRIASVVSESDISLCTFVHPQFVHFLVNTFNILALLNSKNSG